MFDTVEYVKEKKAFLRNRIFRYNFPPCLGIIQVNDDPASNAYVKGKIKDCEELGIETVLIKFDPDVHQNKVYTQILKWNIDLKIHGFIVQLPLPSQISEAEVKDMINPRKDIDGFVYNSWYQPCTPLGIIRLLEANQFEFEGANAVVIGRSNIVGKPMAKMLTNKNCNVTLLHSKTKKKDMRFYLRHADLIVVAVGIPHFLSGYKLNPNAYVIDVGINRVDGKLIGDCEPDLPVKFQTPVPGGIGLITRVTLLENLLEAFKYAIRRK